MGAAPLPGMLHSPWCLSQAALWLGLHRAGVQQQQQQLASMHSDGGTGHGAPENYFSQGLFCLSVALFATGEDLQMPEGVCGGVGEVKVWAVMEILYQILFIVGYSARDT